MHDYFSRVIHHWWNDKNERKTNITDLLAQAVATPEFAELYAKQIGHGALPQFDLGLGNEVNEKWRKLMVDATNTLAVALAAIGAKIASSGISIDPAHIAAIDAHLQTLDTEEGANAAQTQALSDALNGFVAAATATQAAGTPTPSPAASPTASTPPAA